MGEKINNGGPAFPVPNDANVNEQEGMTLRDYFAAKAMQTLVKEWCDGDPKHADGTAEAAYKFADAMLAERDRSALAAYRVQGEGEGV